LSSRAKILTLTIMLLVSGTFLWGDSLGVRTAESLRSWGLSPWMVVVLISMLPIIELRGAIPVAIAFFGMPWYEAVILSIIGNMLPIPLILLFIEWFFMQISKFHWGSRFTKWLFTRTRNKGKVIERYEEIGLAIFVGIPLPGTGAWTGALAAKIFGLPFGKSLLWVFIGVLIAAALVTGITLMGTSFLG
jgi:uncharacterized membrane protein